MGHEHTLEARHGAGREQPRVRPPLEAPTPPAALGARPL